MDMGSITGYAWLTAAVASAGMLWGHARSLFDRLRSFLILSCTIDGEAASGFFLYCRTHLKSSRFDKKHYDSSDMYVRPLKKYRAIAREEYGEFLTFFKGWKPIFVSYKRTEGEEKMTISCLRGMFDVEKMVVEGLALMDQTNSGQKTNRYTINRHFGQINYGKGDSPHHADGEEVTRSIDTPVRVLARGYRILGWDLDDLGLDSDKKPFDALVYPQKIHDFIEVAKHWLASKEFYAEHRIPWRTGAVFYGPPGSGKTSLVRALAQLLDLPIEIFDLPSMTNEELTKKWGRILNRTPCIVLFEDLDRIFDGQNIKGGTINKPTVTLDCLLNCISGVETANGVFVIVTANDVSKLDAALGIPDEEGKSTRPGRLDHGFYLGALDKDCRAQLACHLLKEHPELIAKVVDEGDGETGAQFQKRCGDIALDLYWKEFNKKRTASVPPSPLSETGTPVQDPRPTKKRERSDGETVH